MWFGHDRHGTMKRAGRMFARTVIAASLTGTAAHAQAGPVRATPPPEIVYQVRKGDTLFTLAQAYFINTSAMIRIQNLNHIANPRAIPVGTSLHIPRMLLRDERSQARIESFSGDVSVSMAGKAMAMDRGVTLNEGSEIVTGRNAFVTLRLADGTSVSIASQSSVRIGLLRRVLLTGSVEREFGVSNGKLRAKVTPMPDPGSNFRVTTPITVSAVRGTEYRTEYSAESGLSTNAVDDGTVAVAHAASQSNVLLPRGFGNAATPRESSGAVKLIAAPTMIHAENVQTGETLEFALNPLPEAKAYHIQLARDAGFLDVLAEAAAQVPAFTMAPLPAGSYFARISALDRLGIQGLAETYAFDRRKNVVSGSMGASGHDYLFQWASSADGAPQFRFQLRREGGDGPPIVDETGLTDNRFTVSNLAPGKYAWRVLSILFADGKALETWSVVENFNVAGKE